MSNYLLRRAMLSARRIPLARIKSYLLLMCRQFYVVLCILLSLCSQCFFFPEKMKSAREGIFPPFLGFSRVENGHSKVFCQIFRFFLGFNFAFLGYKFRNFLEFSGGKFGIFFSS